MLINLITTSALPKLGGVAINSASRAAHLSRLGHDVRLCVPWLPVEQQQMPPGQRSSTPDEQRERIRRWLAANEMAAPKLRIAFYRAAYHPTYRMPFPCVTLERHVPPCDLLVLEEPQILFFARPWVELKSRYSNVVGIIHTDHLALAQHERARHRLMIPWYRALARRIVARTCHRVIAIDRVSYLPAATIAEVNGIADGFFQQRSRQRTRQFYAAGRLDKFKGWLELVELSRAAQIEVDVFDTPGPQQDEIRNAMVACGAPLRLQGATLTPAADFGRYRTFINPSRLELYNTSTRQAICMGQWAIVPRVPCNERYFRFANCLPYGSIEEFRRQVAFAAANLPPAAPAESARFAWPRAAQQLLQICFPATAAQRPEEPWIENLAV